MADSPLTSTGTLAEIKMNQLPNLQAIVNITCKSSDIHGSRIFKLFILILTIVTIQINIHPTGQRCSKAS